MNATASGIRRRGRSPQWTSRRKLTRSAVCLTNRPRNRFVFTRPNRGSFRVARPTGGSRLAPPGFPLSRCIRPPFSSASSTFSSRARTPGSGSAEAGVGGGYKHGIIQGAPGSGCPGLLSESPRRPRTGRECRPERGRKGEREEGIFLSVLPSLIVKERAALDVRAARPRAGRPGSGAETSLSALRAWPSRPATCDPPAPHAPSPSSRRPSRTRAPGARGISDPPGGPR